MAAVEAPHRAPRRDRNLAAFFVQGEGGGGGNDDDDDSRNESREGGEVGGGGGGGAFESAFSAATGATVAIWLLVSASTGRTDAGSGSGEGNSSSSSSRSNVGKTSAGGRGGGEDGRLTSASSSTASTDSQYAVSCALRAESKPTLEKRSALPFFVFVAGSRFAAGFLSGVGFTACAPAADGGPTEDPELLEELVALDLFVKVAVTFAAL